MSAPNPTPDEIEARETELFRSGPLSVLTASVKSNSQVREFVLMESGGIQSTTAFFSSSSRSRFSLRSHSKKKKQVLINLRNNHKLLARVKVGERIVERG